MVHRPADSRLLANLLSHEKDYSKHLLALLDYSQASLASFSAYASASSPPVSHVILAVAGSMAGADDALRRYAGSVNEWHEHLKSLKSLEDEVANIIRDREILVTRLIKVSKTQKPTRDSLLISQPHLSASSLSLKSDFSSSLNSKLAAAQSELQACEAHLAAKERELDIRRAGAIREGLNVRCRAMIECGWEWGQMGREGLRALEVLGNLDYSQTPTRPRLPHQAHTPPVPSTSTSAPNRLSIHQPQPQLQSKPLPNPDPSRPSSDLSSLAPSQSASQINLILPNPIPSDLNHNDTHIYSDANYVGYGSSSQHSHTGGAPSSQTHVQPYAHPQTYTPPPPPQQPDRERDQEHRLQIPPAHAISEFALPTSSSVPSSRRHTLSRRITEEDLHHSPEEQDGESSEDVGPVQVVENTRFAGAAGASSSGAGSPGVAGRMFSLRQGTRSDLGAAGAGDGAQKRERRTSLGGKGLFGSLRGLFRHRDGAGAGSGGEKEDVVKVKEKEKEKGGSKWATRTDRNLKGMRDAESDDDVVVGAGVGVGVVAGGSVERRPPVAAARPLSPASPGGGKRLKKGRSTKKKKAAGAGAAGASAGVNGDAKGAAEGAVEGAAGDAVGAADGDGVRRAEEWVGGQDVLAQREREAVEREAREKEREKEREREREMEKEERRWMSDGGVTIVSAGSGVARKKSSKKGKAATLTVDVPGSGANLSRSSSFGSAASAPATMSKARRTSLVVPPVPKVRGSLDDGSGTRKAKSKIEKRASVPPVSAGMGEGSTSLMSIVEGVARGNREGWESVGGTTKRAVGMMEVVRAPPSVGRRELEMGAGGVGERGQGVGAGVEVPKAPGSVFDVQSGSGSGGVTTSVERGRGAGVEIPRAPGSVFDVQSGSGGMVTSGSAPAGLNGAGGSGTGAAKRPAKSPLRSALRNPSRTPSPMPQLPPVPPIPVPTPTPSPPPQPRAPSPVMNGHAGFDVLGKGKGKEREVDGEDADGDTDDDGASVSSYETGHEVFIEDETGDETEREREMAPPPPPPHDPGYARKPMVQDRPAVQTQRQNQNLNHNHSHHQSGSDISASTATSENPGPAAPPPQRRKSVRVSLQPTFSPTPPALDDEDDEHAPWDGPGRQERGSDDGVKDMWEDSSEEDAEYQRAKRLLTRIARREKKQR